MEGAARFFDREGGDVIRCRLCPRRCAIASGRFGACGVRGNKNGKGILPFYGYVTALAVDPIEKKPLYHFRPGSGIISAGFAGCNLRCPFCQNWHISQSTGAPGRLMPPGDLVSSAMHENTSSIAYTYSEPLVHIEFLLDCMALAHRHGIANVLVTNGCINSEAADEVLSLADAANIDLKCFSGETYAKILGGASSRDGDPSRPGFLETVLAFIRLARSKGVHTEVTTLVVPGLNDSDGELDACAAFIESQQIPWHLSAYRPEYRWNAPPTDPVLLEKVRERANKKIRYVYTGNISGGENNTYCPRCNELLIRRRGYRTEIHSLAKPSDGGNYCNCAKCGERIPVTL